MRANIIEGLIWITIACVGFALTYQFDKPLLQYRYGATGWPRALMVAITLFVIIQTIWGIFVAHGKRATDQGVEQVSESPSEGPAAGASTTLRRLGSFGIPLIYLLLMPRTGFFILTPFFLAGYMMLLGERRFVHLVGTTLLIFVLCLIIFTKLLYVPLPVGNWPGFYEINSYFVSFIK